MASALSGRWWPERKVDLLNPTHWPLAIVASLALLVTALGGACSTSDDGSRAPATGAAAATTTAQTTSSAPLGSTTTTTVPLTRTGAAELCDDAVLAQAGPITESGLTEISGVVASRDQPGVLWVHNDSGHPNEVWAIDHEGGVLGRFAVTGARSVDWEDIGIGAGPTADRSHLYVGDTGDNSFTPVLGSGLDPRSEANPVMIYRVLEPEVEAVPGDGAGTDATSEIASDTEPGVAFAVAYDDGPRDAEALLVDPVTGDVFVISKQWDRSPPGLYRLPAATVTADAAPGGITTMERVADVAEPDGDVGPGLITGADISADGTLVALRTYGSVILWDRDPTKTLAETMVEPPTCTRKVDEPQGEAVAFGADGDALVTISEGEGVPLNWLRLPAG